MNATATKQALTQKFFTAGKAVFTVSNPTGEHFTYRINAFKDMFFVNVLSGPDNTHDYTYVGMINSNSGDVFLTRKSRVSADSKSFRVVKWAMRQVWAGRDLPEGYEIRHEGKCGRCARTLTVPESIDSGIGPVCAEKMGL